MAYVGPTGKSPGDLITAANWNQDVVNNVIALTPAGLSFVIDGGGSEMSTGDKGEFEIPFKCTMDAVRLGGFAGPSTAVMSINVDIRKTSNRDAGYPNSTGSLADSTGFVIASDNYGERTGLTDQLSAGDWLSIYVNTVSTSQRVTVAPRLTRN